MAALLRTKRLAWVSALFLATLVLSFSYVSGRKYLNALAWVEHTQTVVRTLTTLLSDVRELESSSRGYVLSGDRTLLEHDLATRRDIAGALKALGTLVSDSPSQLARRTAIERVLGLKLAIMAENVELRGAGQLEAATRRMASLRGKGLMDQLRSLVTEMEQEEQQLLEARSNAARRTQHETIAAIAGCAFVMFVLAALGFLGMQRDARELRDAAAELAESEERYRILVENVSDLVTIHGADGELTFVSPSIEALLGLTPEEARTLAAVNLLHPEDVASARYSLQKFQSGEVGNGVVTCRLRRRDGEYRWFEFKVTRVTDPDGKLRHFQAAGRDVTVRRQLEQRLADQAEELRHLSLRDGLTGLYNRRGFLELSAQVVRVAEREHHRLALLFIDLDGLKRINDELGHGHGDRAIAEAADLLRSSCRATDIVARLGGDEFVLLASNVEGESLEILRRRLERALAQANEQPNRDYVLSFSLGLASFDPLAPVPLESLLVEADARMYEAKGRRQRPQSRSVELVAGVA
jgi:diguanylate cyclase (GGDEF)-like protein/PAS domain S-box-containing protein